MTSDGYFICCRILIGAWKHCFHIGFQKSIFRKCCFKYHNPFRLKSGVTTAKRQHKIFWKRPEQAEKQLEIEGGVKICETAFLGSKVNKSVQKGKHCLLLLIIVYQIRFDTGSKITRVF